MKKTEFGKPDAGKIRQSFRTKAFRAGGYSIAAVAIVVAIAVALNLFVGALPSTVTKLDMTTNQLYSLSEQSKQIASDLQTDVTIYWIVQSGQENSTLQHLLDRYTSLSKHIQIVKKDPVVYPNFAAQYTDSQISNNSLVVVCGDRNRYIANSDIFVTDYSNYYTTGTTSTEFAGEEKITSALDYVTTDQLTIVYTLSGHGESSLPSDLSDAVKNENITVEDLSLLTESAVPDDAACLMIYAPQSDLSETERDTILSYLESGGKLLLVTDYTTEEMPNLMAVMDYYGVSLVPGIVIEGDSSRCLSGYAYCLLPQYGSHTITDPLSEGGYYVLAPVAQGIQVSDTLRDTETVTKLLTTSDQAYSKLAGYDMTTYDKESGDIDGGFAVSVAVTETVDQGTTNLVWFTSSEMFQSQYNQVVSGGNYDLFVNALGWMCQREDSVSIHSKSLSVSYLTVSDASSATWSFVMVGLLPLGMLATGIVITVKRRRRA